AGLCVGAGVRAMRPAEAQGPVTLTLGMWSSSPAEATLVKNQVKAFEAKNPNIRVHVQVINGNYLQALQTRLASHTAPDIFYVDSSYAPTLEASGALMPLDSYIKQDGVKLSAYSPALVKAFQWKGTTYGIPKDMNTLALEYNPTLLAKAGISAPPKTWEQFESDAAKLKAKHIAPLSVAIDVARYYPFVLDDGGSYFDANKDQATFTNSKNVAGLNFFLQNMEKGYFVQPSDQGGSWPGVPFSQGKVAFTIEGAWIVPFMQQTAPKMKWGVADFPSLNGKDTNFTYTVSYSMSATTQHPAEAAKLLFFMTGAQALKMTADSGLAIPSLTNEQSYFLKKYPNYKAFVDGVKNAVPYQFGTLGQNFLDAINNATQAGVLKKQSAQTVLQSAQKTLATQSNY
ncbi:MAG: ABC transporter substrate-binding protein, partial [Alicyclobacillus sp.]|nr:ABC transporter substrate-binding protein [Alicyclobacillus sp.]